MVKGTAASTMLKRLDQERALKGTASLTTMFQKVRRGARPSLADLPSPATPRAARMRVDEIVLFRSELSPSGARYAPLEHLALGAPLAPLSSESQHA